MSVSLGIGRGVYVCWIATNFRTGVIQGTRKARTAAGDMGGSRIQFRTAFCYAIAAFKRLNV
jgi:hypothetical protein